MKVFFTYDYGKEKMKAVEELGYELIYKDERTISNNQGIEDIDVLVCYDPFDNVDITKLNNLKWIQLSSIGIDQVPKRAVLDMGITVTNNKSGYSIPMGEWVVMKALELLKNSRSFYKKQEEGHWKVDTSVLEIYNKTIVFVGTGSIAQESAKRFQGFGVKIVGVNTSGRNVQYFDECHAFNEIDEVLKQADIIVLALPHTEKTHHLFDIDRFKLFKPSSYLINISRGSIINEDDMVEALKKGIIAGAALDVFEEEPLPQDSPLWQLDNVIVTPHSSWISEMRNERRYNIIYENLKHYIKGEQLKNIVDLEKGY
jgi:phosphoglycerate dehydrogenase-like enzyme